LLLLGSCSIHLLHAAALALALALNRAGTHKERSRQQRHHAVVQSHAVLRLQPVRAGDMSS
jgi:hypothetical protein